MWKNEDVGACPCYPTQQLLQALDKVIDQIEDLGVKYLPFKPGDLYKNVDKTMEDAGFRKIGEGLTRLVYGFKDEKGCNCVVKVAKSKMARVSNYNEMAVMIDAPEDVRSLFLRLGAADEDGWWVTQPKADFPDRDERFGLAEVIRDRLDDKGWRCIDLHEDNVGLYVNKPVVVNYGFGLNCTKTGSFVGSKGGFKVTEAPTSEPAYYREFAFGSKGFKSGFKRREPEMEKPVAPGEGTAWPTSSFLYEGLSEEE